MKFLHSRNTCRSQVDFARLADVVEKWKTAVGLPRSGCPVSVSLERFGDRWSLLLIRDMMVRGYKTFKQFQESGEGIATNILANRLDRLRAAGIVETEPDVADGRRVIYRLTEKGIDLAPVLLDLLLWASKWEETAAPCEMMQAMGSNRDRVLEEVRRRWRERDPEPFLSPFRGAEQALTGSGVNSAGGGKKERTKKGAKR